MQPGQTIAYKQNASNEQLQSALEKALPAAAAQVKNISSKFKGATDTETCRKIFDFLKKEIQYDKDGFTQKLNILAPCFEKDVATANLILCLQLRS